MLTMFTIRRPRLKFLAPLQSTKFNCFQKTKKYRRCFSYRFFAPPWSFLYPQIFFPHCRTLIWPTYGTFLQPNNFDSKFWRPLLMVPRGNRGYVTPLSRMYVQNISGMYPESPLDGIPTGRNPHWMEFPPNFLQWGFRT